MLPGLNNALGVFIPKGEVEADKVVGVHRAPEATRPLYLSNTDNKIVSMALNRPFGYLCQMYCHTVQKGLIRGRQMSENIINLEARMITWWCQLGAKNCGYALFDVRAAFPSLLHCSIMFVLVLLPTTTVAAM